MRHTGFSLPPEELLRSCQAREGRGSEAGEAGGAGVGTTLWPLYLEERGMGTPRNGGCHRREKGAFCSPTLIKGLAVIGGRGRRAHLSAS